MKYIIILFFFFIGMTFTACSGGGGDDISPCHDFMPTDQTEQDSNQ